MLNSKMHVQVNFVSKMQTKSNEWRQLGITKHIQYYYNITLFHLTFI